MTTAAPPLAGSVAGVFLCPEKIYAFTALIALSGAFLPLVVGYADASEKAFANPLLIQTILSGIYVVAAALLLRMKVLGYVRLSVPALLLLLLGFTAASFAWSIDPGLTLKRLVPLLGTTLVGVYLGARFTLEGVLRTAFVACFAMTAGSLTVGFALPQYGIQPGEAAWAGLRGVFANKNILGSMAALAAVVSVYYIAAEGARDRLRLWAGAAGLTLATLCVILSLSASSCIVAVVTFVAVAALRHVQRSSDPVVPAVGSMILILAAGIALSPDNLSALFELFGRDATLTGRVDLWNFTIQLIAVRPWLGYGYAVAWDKLGWYFHVAYVHNGFLQVTLDLGVLGLALCLLFLAQVASRCLSLLRRSSWFRSTFPAALLVLILLGNTTEVSLVTGHSLLWCLLVFVAVQTTIDLGRGRSPAKFGPGANPQTHSGDTSEADSHGSRAQRG